MRTNSADTAFPSQIFFDEHLVDCSDGLTKREYFAAMAMQGLLARDVAGIGAEANAKAAVEQADALINWLNRGQQ
ncbi:MAG: hypothetical protein HC840_13070 [Leptolyngbyaceae cyanobacterium RM2_2_4]|nr:hypothetical protein [Leptolyngbyaceae cyanobacterium SL_5_14]NJO50210.1 hypothetical protein [Leptolyngbyaceae cyanobacterium RM2_2_4]NJO67293.1 hypothetical protein [Leptolyngbyaceae cyanobacterium RM1_405_57]